MMILAWAPDARRDLARLRDFLGPKNPAAAEREAERILRAARSLLDQPALGRMTDDGAFRELVVKAGAGAYVLRYQVVDVDDAIVIARVWHGREDRG